MLRPLLILLSLVATPAIAQAPRAPRVVTDLPLTASLVAEVMGDLGAPEALVGRDTDPHHAQLRPSQVRALAGAELVVWIGPDLSPWLEDPMLTLAGGPVLTLAEVDGLHRQGFVSGLELGAGAGDHDAEDSHDDHGNDHGAVDPHLWLDPQNAMVWLHAIAAALSARDPDNAALYTARAEAAVESLQALQVELAATLAPVGDTGLVMFHDAYGYFATAFNLNVMATISDGAATAPGAARIAALRAGLAEAGATCLFPEANQPEDFVRVVAEGSALRIGAPLDPEGLMLDPGPGLYAALLRELAQAIADCAAP